MSKNKKKTALKAVVAAGMTAGTVGLIHAQDNPNAIPQPPIQQEENLSAADAVIIDGQEIEFEGLLAQQVQQAPRDRATVYGPPPRDRVRPMYGPPAGRDRIRLMYGPRPRPGIIKPDINKPEWQDVYDKTTDIFVGVLKIDPTTISPESQLVDDLNIGENASAEIIEAIKQVFNVELTTEQFYNAGTFFNLVTTIVDVGNNTTPSDTEQK